MTRPVDRDDAPSTSLTARYVEAAMRTVPEEQRTDLATELRASIHDQVEARIADGEDPSAAERAVLTALGDPDRLAAGYTDRPLYLIGPRLFLDWWRLLKLLLSSVGAAVMFAVALGAAVDVDPCGEIVGSVVVTGMSVAVHLAFWTTLVFAVVERTTSRRDQVLNPWTVDKLPEKQDCGRGVGELVTALLMLALAAGAVLWDHTRGFVLTGQSDESFLDPSLWPVWTAGLFVLIGAQALLAVTVFAHRGWNLPLAAVNALLNAVLVVGVAVLYAQDRLVNPQFFPSIIEEGATDVTPIISTVLLFVVVGSSVWDSFDTFRKAGRA